ncbi:TPA: hypothetical protein ACKQEZ_005333, partial [Serratia marcescens]
REPRPTAIRAVRFPGRCRWNRRFVAALPDPGAALHRVGAKSVMASKSDEIIFASAIRNPEVFRN